MTGYRQLQVFATQHQAAHPLHHTRPDTEKGRISLTDTPR
jgi:hypothetical protein